MSEPEKTASLGQSGWVSAKTYTIVGKPHPALDSCWSACNGIDGFGEVEKDTELNQVRSRYGENLEKWPACPRLILYRKTKQSPLFVSVWRTMHLEYDNVIETMAKLASACADSVEICNPAEWDDTSLHIDLIDWDGNRPDAKGLIDSDSRYELSISLNGMASMMPWIKRHYLAFSKVFDAEKGLA